MDTAAMRVSLGLVTSRAVDGLSARPRMRGPKTCIRSTTKRRSADRHRPGLILIGNESSPVEQPRPSHPSIYRGCQR